MPKLTSLTRSQYQKVANSWIKDNPERWKQIRATHNYPYSELQRILEPEYGKAVWRDRPGRNKITGSTPTADDLGVPFTLEDKGNGRAGFKSTPTRSATRGQPTGNSSGTRAYLEHAASAPDTDFADANRAMAEARASGTNMDGGHITPLDRKVRGQEFITQTGRSTVQQMNQQFDHAGIPYGHTRANIEPQTAKANRIDQRADYAKLDKHLKALDKFYSPLTRGTARKVLLRSLGLVPLLGAAGNAVDAAERTRLAAETNDPLDKLQAGIASTSVASTGWAEPVGFAADVGNTLIDLTRFLANPITRQQLNQGARQSFTGANTGRY
jgi:hypothetical protein